MKKTLYTFSIAVVLLMISHPASADMDSDVINIFMRHVPGSTTTPAGTLSRQLEIAAHDPTLSLLHTVRNWDNLRSDTQATLGRYINVSSWKNGKRTVSATSSFDSCDAAVPESSNETMDSEHFRIVYTTNAASAHKSTTDYITAFLQEAEKSWTKEVNTIGLPAPKLPSDNKLRIYVCNLMGIVPGTLGRTWTTSVDSSDDTALTFIELDNDYAEMSLPSPASEYAGLVFAHEFFHSIQFGINYAAPSYWLLESNATWIEEEVYPDSNDYITLYVRSRFTVLDKSIDYFSFSDIYGYGASIFFRHITENIADVAFIPAMWNTLKSTCILSQSNPQWKSWCLENTKETPLVDSTLQGYGTDIEDTFRDFSVANYTKKYIDGTIDTFPDVPETTIPITNYLASASGELDHLAAKFYRIDFSTSTSQDPPNLSFTGSTGADWRVTAILESQGGSRTVEHKTLSDGNYTGTLDTLGDTDSSVLLIVNNTHLSADDASFTVSVVFPQPEIISLSHTFPKGWNLVGIPLQPDGATLQDAFELGDTNFFQFKNGVYYYDAEQDPPAPGMCYWVYFENETTITSNGFESTTNVVNLKKGWNFISIPYDAPEIWNNGIMVNTATGTYSIDSIDGNNLVDPEIFIYNGSIEPVGYAGPIVPDGSYTIKQWECIAIKALQDGQLVFPGILGD